MNQITPEQLLAKIGLLVMENDILRIQLTESQQKLIEIEKKMTESEQKLKDKDNSKNVV